MPLSRPTLSSTVAAALLAFSSAASAVSLDNSFAAFAGLSATVGNRVVGESVSGTLDFSWRIPVDPASTGGLDTFHLGDFSYSHPTDADWRVGALGSAAPDSARLFTPLVHPEGAIPIPPGTNASRFLVLNTNATAHETPSGTLSTSTPAEPEPSSMLLLGLGLAALGLTMLRRIRGD